MKRIIVPAVLTVLATIAASALASCKGGEGRTSIASRPVPPTTLPAAGPHDRQAAVEASSPLFALELARRRLAWVQQRPSQEENKMTPERVRRMEMSRLELASLAQEAAATTMGLAEADKLRLRQALLEFRDATLFRIEHPDAGPGTDVEPYGRSQRRILGETRYADFSRLEQLEREQLIAARRAFRKNGSPQGEPAGSSPGP